MLTPARSFFSHWIYQLRIFSAQSISTPITPNPSWLSISTVTPYSSIWGINSAAPHIAKSRPSVCSTPLKCRGSTNLSSPQQCNGVIKNSSLQQCCSASCIAAPQQCSGVTNTKSPLQCSSVIIIASPQQCRGVTEIASSQQCHGVTNTKSGLKCLNIGTGVTGTAPPLLFPNTTSSLQCRGLTSVASPLQRQGGTRQATQSSPLVVPRRHQTLRQMWRRREKTFLGKVVPKARVRRRKKKKMNGKCQMKGVILKTLIKHPKKPNSANRKCVRVRLSDGRVKDVYVPGEGHNLQEHQVVLVEGARLKDLPGVHMRVIRGALDCGHVVKKTQTA